MERVISMSMVS